MPVIDPNALVANRVDAIRSFHRTTGIARAEIDVSGGVDSAVMLALLCRALPAEKITPVYSSIHSSTDSRDRARATAAACGIALVEVELTDIFEQLQTRLLDSLVTAGFDLDDIRHRMAADPAVAGSIRSCLRAPVGRGANRLTGGGIRHGTGNECEDRFLRFFQKGGDGEVDSNPIAMLSKGEVFQLGRALEVPRGILEAVPSPDLHGIGEDHNDEDELQALHGVAWTYSQVDVDSGDYKYVGTIERMSRLLDESGVEAKVFGAAELTPQTMQELVATAAARTFASADAPTITAFVDSARQIERATRHKMNPNCPTYGCRNDLLAAGILSDTIPTV